MASLGRLAIPSLGAGTRARVLSSARPSARITRLFAAIQTRHLSGPYGYTQAKTLVFSKFGEPADVLTLHRHSISPSLPPKSVLVRALVSPINPSDVNTIQGTYGVKPTFDPLLGTATPSAIPGNEGVFEVVSLSSGVESLKKGDWVIPATTGFGTFRTHAVVENADKALFRIGGEKGHEGLTPTQVATVSVNPCSAYRMLRDYVDLIKLSVDAFAKGEGATGGAWFIQNGANSAVGRAAIQFGNLWGLRSINVVRERATPKETEALKEELKGLGATVVVTEAEFLENAGAEGVNYYVCFLDEGLDQIDPGWRLDRKSVV